ncbi:hypothetical protein FA743_08995 [Paracoccus gahaiensis]|uniref:Sulfotransferase family protein n=1 Tax=Paracoccus gahaiensis TaxID=1706839 RepID=A0A4U0RAQ1_9RHOB|nr:hypothetical protein [Paracoccus gahaiensis]TJZ91946.1 hypothetical protein FA743_08995 [Paracoccus gahaiensis]
MYLYVKVFGERNSGTIYLNALIRENTNAIILDGDTKGKGGLLGSDNLVFPDCYTGDNDYLQDMDHVRMLNSDFGWKHAAPPLSTIEFSPFKNFCRLVFTTKHPVFWLKSMYNRPYNPRLQRADGFSNFIRAPWPVSRRDNLGCDSVPTPVELYNRKVLSYIEASRIFAPNSIFVKYEDLLADTEATASKICSDVLGYGNGKFKNVLNSTKSSEENFEFYKNKYLSEDFGYDVSQEDLEFIKQKLSPRVMRYCNYDFKTG